MAAGGMGCVGAMVGRNRRAVKKDLWWGYVNTEGRLVTRHAYREADDFRLGLAPVKVEGLYGYIDRTGAMRIKPRFQHASRFSQDGVASVSLAAPRPRPESGAAHGDGEFVYIDREGREIVARRPGRP